MTQSISFQPMAVASLQLVPSGATSTQADNSSRRAGPPHYQRATIMKRSTRQSSIAAMSTARKWSGEAIFLVRRNSPEKSNA